MPKAFWPPQASRRPPIVQREFRGENRLDPYSIADVFATSTKNLTSSAFPGLTVKPGYTLLGAAIGTKVLGIGVWKDTEIHAVFNDGTWRKWTGAAWSAPLASGLSLTAEWSFCNFKGNLGDFNLIAANGVDPVKRYDGGTLQDLAGAPAGANYIDEHDNRLYCVVNGVEVHFSELSVPSNWTVIGQNDSDPGTIIKEINTGKKIVGLKAGAGHVTVFFPTSSHELYGTSPSDFRFMEVAADIGAINNKSAVSLDGWLYFAGELDNYKYGGGSRPDKTFAQRMQWYMQHMNQAAKLTSCVGSDGRKLYTGIPIDSATAPDTIIEYDPQHDTFYTWKDISPLCFARMANTLYIGDAQGRVLKVGGTTHNGAAILWHWISKPFSSASMAQVIRWLRAWITTNVPAGSTMNIYLSKLPEGDSDWVLVKTIAADAVVESTPIYIPSNVAANTRFIRIKFEGTGPMNMMEFAREQTSMPIK